MPDTKISIEIKDKIAAGIAPKLDAIGKAAAGAAPGLQAFKTVWKGFDFSGMAGLGLGRVNNQLKAVKKSTYDLRRSSEQLLTSQLRTKNTSAQYEKTLNSLTLQKQRLQKAGLGAEAAENSLAASQFKLRGILTATVDVTTKLTDSQIKQAKKANALQLSNDRVARSYTQTQREVIKTSIKEQELIEKRNKSKKSATQLATAEKTLSKTNVDLANSTATLRNTLIDLDAKEQKLIASGNGLVVTQAKLASQMVAMAQSSTVSAKLTSKLSDAEIKRQKVLNGLKRDQDLTAISANKLVLSNIDVRKATANAVIEEQKAIKSTNQAATSLIKKQKALNSLNASTTVYSARTATATNRTISFTRALRTMRTAALGNRGAIGGMVSSLRSYLSLGALLGAGGALKGIDSFKRIQNQIRGTTTSSEQLEIVTDELFAVAQRARVPIADLTIAYRRYDNALSKVGMGQKGSLRITETIGKMLSLNGASATESASALLQLSQAFNKGKLDGDEFRSVAELMPQILDAIAKATGKARSELFKMSRNGEITVDVLVKAFQSLEKPIDRLMKDSSRTIGQAFTQLTNKLIYQFGQWDKKTKFTEKLAKIIDTIGENLDSVLRSIKALAAGLIASGLASAIGGIVAAIASGVGLLAFLPGLLGVITARIVYLGDQIKIGMGELEIQGLIFHQFITLDQLLGSMLFNFDAFFRLIKNIGAEFIKIVMPAELLKSNFDALLAVANLIKGTLNVIGGIFAGVGKSIMFALFEKEENETAEGLTLVFKNLAKLAYQQFLFLPLKLIELFTHMIDGLAPVIAHFAAMFYHAFTDFFDWFDSKAIGSAVTAQALGKLVEMGTGVNTSEGFEQLIRLARGQGLKAQKKVLEGFKNTSLAEVMRTTAAIEGRIKTISSRVREESIKQQEKITPKAKAIYENFFKGFGDFTAKADSLITGYINNMKSKALLAKMAEPITKPLSILEQHLGKFGAAVRVTFSGVVGIIDSAVEPAALGLKSVTDFARSAEERLLKIFKEDSPIVVGAQVFISVLEKAQGLLQNISTLRLPKSIAETPLKIDAKESGLPQMTEQASALQSVFSNLSNAFQNFVRTGKLSFKELMRSILADLLKLFMNKLFQQLFQGIMGGGGGGGFLGGLFGGGMAGGGVVSAAGGYGSTTTKLPGG